MVAADDRATWRSWLEVNHATARGAWLVTWRRGHGPVLAYEEAVEEALCFGWVDSTAGRVDDRRSKLYFAPRKPGSGWAATNKARVERLLAAGLMAPAGIAAVERAKADGSWTSLDAIELGIIPDDLVAALAAHPPAAVQLRGIPEVGTARDSRLDRDRKTAGDARRRGCARPRSGPLATSARTSVQRSAEAYETNLDTDVRGNHPGLVLSDLPVTHARQRGWATRAVATHESHPCS